MSQHQKLRVAVVGAGHMGVNHIKAYQKRDDVELIGVVDTNERRVCDIAATYGCRILNFADVSKVVDAVSIVTPSHTHFPIGQHFLSKGIHCLVEKPLALNAEDSYALAKTAEAARVTLLVGHVEEYNSGFQYIKDVMSEHGELPRHIACERFNFGSDRIQDTDVVIDLMIHDLGCVFSLLGDDARYLELLSAHGNGRLRSVDGAVAVLKAHECIITLQANRLAHQRHRAFILHTRSFSYMLDFISQQVSVFHKNQLVSQTNHPWKSPLDHEIAHFVECIRDAKRFPLTGGHKSAQVLACALNIQEHIYTQRQR